VNENLENDQHPPLGPYDEGNMYTEQNEYRARSVLSTGRMFASLRVLGFPYIRNLNAYVGEHVYWSLGKQIDGKSPAFYHSRTRIDLEDCNFYIGKIIMYEFDFKRVVIQF